MTKIHRQLLPPAAKNPFEKGFLDLPKLFNWEGLGTLFFFVLLRVASWLKLKLPGFLLLQLNSPGNSDIISTWRL